MKGSTISLERKSVIWTDICTLQSFFNTIVLIFEIQNTESVVSEKTMNDINTGGNSLYEYAIYWQHYERTLKYGFLKTACLHLAAIYLNFCSLMQFQQKATVAIWFSSYYQSRCKWLPFEPEKMRIKRKNG